MIPAGDGQQTGDGGTGGSLGRRAIDAARETMERGGRLSSEAALELLGCHDLPALGALADGARWKLWPEPVVTYVIGRNLNYTNVCWVRCKFCAFYRPPGDERGYTLSRDELAAKIQELVDLGGREVLFQGGLNPALKLDWYLDTFRWIKSSWDVHLHALSPAEILYLAHISSLPLERCLGMLRDAGLDTVPGAGGEILVDRVRAILAPGKDMSGEWIDFMRTCHRMGIRTSSTMMYGSVETPAERVEHLDRLRRLQDETGGFNSFIPWSFQPDLTEMPGTPRASAFDYLRTLAVARLYLDNIRSIQASWVTQGAKIAQVSLRFGVNDFGSSVIEENVVSAAGGTHRMDIEEMERLIRDAGFTPMLRDTNYRILGPYRRPARPALPAAAAMAADAPARSRAPGLASPVN
ncbi:MAG TPA: cyclic dehypoxanthinyl futalosine synthase [Candidatus Polarisedimenticolia bacterium]|nr:cyclic dehypoxanthinyl futalosine synthase [Candidatus Polarisedimenticolia bacterium]